MIECEEVGCCTREFRGLCACDLRALADAFYPDRDPSRRRFTRKWAERMFLVRTLLRALAVELGGHDRDDHQAEVDGARCRTCAAPIR